MKKLIFVFSVIAVLALSTLTASAISGDGTEESPFLIENQGDLELVTDFPDCHFKLANDIELEGTWIPLCKETSSGRFNGVFDGNGYTISNLLTDGSEGGLFKGNYGTIENVKVVIADEGTKGNGAIAYYNYGTISNCSAKGNISGYFKYMGGICAINYSVIKQCKFEGNLENTYSSSSSSILGSTGGICGDNSKQIENCCFIGGITSKSSYKAGIAGYSSGSSTAVASITNCYAVPTFNIGGKGIVNNEGYSSVKKSYYDKTVSGLTGTDYGTPKSTTAMKMKQTYATDWDFDTVWGINKNINDGYPYLLWEYPDIENEADYSIDSVKITDLSGSELAEIPEGSFYFEIDVTKNTNSKEADCLIIAVYDENNNLIDVKYMKGIYYQNQEISFATMINQDVVKVGKIKTFIWNSVSGATPLSNAIEAIN